MSEYKFEINNFYQLEGRLEGTSTEQRLVFFEEIDGNNESYWINASESVCNQYSHVAIRFTVKELVELRDSIDKVLFKDKEN